jgi:serine/threonine-protein phosphatase 4 catalytic subunit
MSGLDVDQVIDELKLRKMPTEAQIKELCEKATSILGEEDNVQMVQAPVTICGDLHGEQWLGAAHP